MELPCSRPTRFAEEISTDAPAFAKTTDGQAGREPANRHPRAGSAFRAFRAGGVAHHSHWRARHVSRRAGSDEEITAPRQAVDIGPIRTSEPAVG